MFDIDSDAYRSKSGRSSVEEGFYMQEIVSPFRQLRLSALGSGPGGGCAEQRDSPEHEYAKQMDATPWQINPMKVRRPLQEAGAEEDEYFFEDEEDEVSAMKRQRSTALRSSSPEGYSRFDPGRRCSNPYLRADFGDAAPGLERRVSSPVISPGKLKAQVTQSRAAIMEHIMATQLEIEENSPSRTGGSMSTVNRELIQSLKERRLLQRSKSREGPGGAGPIAEPDSGMGLALKQMNKSVYEPAILNPLGAPRETSDTIMALQEKLLRRPIINHNC